mmetsp:Transcript_114177/g.209803  ORF Transcript_114177/g.209803 Transcript_114177/m.209803 type:complete len:89 (-) Transcript_114177:877-1143(-)
MISAESRWVDPQQNDLREAFNFNTCIKKYVTHGFHDKLSTGPPESALNVRASSAASPQHAKWRCEIILLTKPGGDALSMSLSTCLKSE